MPPSISASRTEPAASSPSLGEALGPWQLEGFLGEGASGRVYLGRHRLLGRAAAIKMLHAEHTADAARLQRFFLEARTVAQINHEHIVEVYDFVQEEVPHRAYCVMELLLGTTLTSRCESGPLALDLVLRITGQLASALGAAHAVGVVHRDLKPDNVFLVSRGGADDFVKVLDFGVAKLLTTATSIGTNDTLAGAIIGTPRYMSPEQVAGLDVDERADVYALGTVLYELLSGHPPFQARATAELFADVLRRPAPPLPSRTAHGEPLPPVLRALTMACLEKQPRDRPASMAAVLAALDSRLAAPSLAPRRWRARALAGVAAGAVAALGLALGAQPSLGPLPVVTPVPDAPVSAGDTNAVLALMTLASAPTVFGPFLQPASSAPALQPSVEASPRAVPARPHPAKPRKALVREGVLDPFDE